MPRWLIGLLGCGGLVGLLVVALVVVAIVSGPPKTSQSGGGQDSSTEEKQKPSTDRNAVEVGVGQSGELRDRTLVVNEVERNYAPPDRFSSSRIEPGNEFVRVYITLKNTGTQSFNYNLHNFKAQDSNGVQRDPETITQLPNRVDYGGLAAGGTLQGNMAFQAPQGDRGLSLVYEPFERNVGTVTVTPL